MQPPIATVRSVWHRVFDRQNLHRLVSFLFQLSLLSTVAAVCPFILRILILPSSIQHEIPLNLVFSTCPDDLHGVCSFPTATLEYDQHSLFTRSVSYSLSVRLNFADLDQNRQLSMFQNQLSVHDAEGRLLKNYMRSAYLKEPGLITKLTCLAFLPLYLLGFICNYSTIDILLTDSHIENLERASAKIIYSLHDKYAQVDSAYLVVHANFGLVRHFTYFWPISFYLLIFIPTFSFLFFMLTIYWAISVAKSQSSESAVAEDEADDNEDAATESSAALDEQIPKDLETILNSEDMAESDQLELTSNNAVQLSSSFANLSIWCVFNRFQGYFEEFCNERLSSDLDEVDRHAACALFLRLLPSPDWPDTPSVSRVLWQAACEWGSRARDGSYCDPCRSPLHGYDWMFLGFCAIVPLLINLSYVRVHSPKRISRTHQFLEYLSCGFECILAAIISILLYEPKWSFKLYGCQKAGYKDWYPALYNPVIGFAKTMKCSYEVVYPLFSLPLVYLAILSLIIPTCRGLLYVVAFKRKRDAMAVYSAILGLPQWAILHILGAGIIFTSFPFLLLLSSLTSNAMHLSMQGRLTIRQILKLLFTSPIHITILLCNTAFFGFAVLSLTSTEDLRSLYWLLLSPLPMIFYILTIGLSHPSVLTETAA